MVHVIPEGSIPLVGRRQHGRTRPGGSSPADVDRVERLPALPTWPEEERIMLWDIFLYLVLAAWLALWLLRDHGFFGIRRGAIFGAARRDAPTTTGRHQ